MLYTVFINKKEKIFLITPSFFFNKNNSLYKQLQKLAPIIITNIIWK